jgi:ethanolamine utilization protein EutQ (cupin superfamily)
MDNCKIDFSSLPWQNPFKGLRYKTFNDGKRQISILEYSSDFVDKEWCQKGHYGYVISGQGELIFNDRKVQVSAGDGIFLPAGPQNKHQAKSISDTVTIFLVGDVQ